MDNNDYNRVALCCGKEDCMFSIVAALTGGTSVIDTGIVSELIALVRSVMGLFTDFPLNVLLIASLAFVAFGLFSRAKHAAM